MLNQNWILNPFDWDCPGTKTSLWILIVNNYPSPQGNSYFRTVEVDLEGRKGMMGSAENKRKGRGASVSLLKPGRFSLTCHENSLLYTLYSDFRH